MKAKILRDDLEVTPSAPDEGVERRDVMRNGEVRPVRFWKVGALVDDPLAFRLVQMGVAEPADDECRDRAARTDAQLKAAQHAYERQSRGIAPEDFERYDRGEISRLLPDGTYEAGPNATQDDEDDDESGGTVSETAPKTRTPRRPRVGS